jgi:hypothetical protein
MMGKQQKETKEEIEAAHQAAKLIALKNLRAQLKSLKKEDSERWQTITKSSL